MAELQRPTIIPVWLQPLAAAFLGLLISAGLVWIIGEDPAAVFGVFFRGAFGTTYDIGLSLFYALPLACTGLAVCMGLRARLFNIGVEGQLTFGAFFAALAGLYGPSQPHLNRIFGLCAALLGGFLWAALLAYLRAYRKAHEVVSGIMLNFVAFGLTSWLALNFFKNPTSQSAETEALDASVRFTPWPFFDQAPLGFHALVVPLAALLVWIFFRWSRLGYSLEATGAKADAAEQGGISVASMQFWSLGLGGLFAGLVGFIEVYGNTGRFVVGFSPGYGFVGIAVALLGRLQPLGILLSAALFGAILKGSLDLDFETEKITRDFALILQAVLILLMSCSLPIPSALSSVWQRIRRTVFGTGV